MKRRHVVLASLSLSLLHSPPVEAHHMSTDRVKELIRAKWGHRAGEALRVAKCESQYRHWITHHNRNGTIDYGVFQLNSGGTLQSLGLTTRTALDPVANINAAYRLFKQSHNSFKRWTCR